MASYLQYAVCVRRKKKGEKKKSRKNPAPPRTHHETHISPATATTSRRHVMEHVPRVGPCSPGSIDPGLNFVEIGLVQLSQSVKTTNVTHTDGHTDRLNNGTLYTPRYEEAFLSSYVLVSKTTYLRQLYTEHVIL